MRLSFDVEGAELEGLDRLDERLAQGFGEQYAKALGLALRHVTSRSPVVTGSYQAAHRIVVGRNEAKLGISASARNSVSGVLVSRYSGAVERRHGVYASVVMVLPRVATEAAQFVVQEVRGGY